MIQRVKAKWYPLVSPISIDGKRNTTNNHNNNSNNNNINSSKNEAKVCTLMLPVEMGAKHKDKARFCPLLTPIHSESEWQHEEEESEVETTDDEELNDSKPSQYWSEELNDSREGSEESCWVPQANHVP
ncbi:unnamed protein product, partial [Polarella glacialis]